MPPSGGACACREVCRRSSPPCPAARTASRTARSSPTCRHGSSATWGRTSWSRPTSCRRHPRRRLSASPGVSSPGCRASSSSGSTTPCAASSCSAGRRGRIRGRSRRTTRWISFRRWRISSRCGAAARSLRRSPRPTSPAPRKRVSAKPGIGSAEPDPHGRCPMAELNGGALLARCLANEGVRLVFGLPSPEIDPLLAALDEHGIRLVPFRHESAGAHMAEGFYKTTGQVAVVIGNPGPGSANLVGGVITARHEGVPMLAITSQHRLGIVYPSLPSTFQGQDQLDVFKPVVKWGGPIFSWDRIPEVVRVAFREMWTGRPGPVHIELPAPVLYATGDESSVRVSPPAAYRAPLPESSDARIAEVADLLAGAARPLVFAGSGVDRAGANEELLAIAERLGCPLITSMAGRAVRPLDHPNAVYGLGAGGDLAKRQADVVLVAGSRLGNLDLPYDKYWGDPATQQIVQIDIDPRHIGVTRPVAVGIVADVKQALAKLASALASRPRPTPAAFLARWCASPATAPPASTSWRCSPPRASVPRSPSSSRSEERRVGKGGSSP